LNQEMFLKGLSKLSSVSMSSVTPEELEQILETIEKAMEMHNKWYEGTMRTLLCKLPIPLSITARDAHNRCDFGYWLYSERNSRLHDLPAFNTIEELHKAMHDSARELSLKYEVNAKVSEEDYDHFMSNVTRFRNELSGFRARVLATLNHMHPKE